LLCKTIKYLSDLPTLFVTLGNSRAVPLFPQGLSLPFELDEAAMELRAAALTKLLEVVQYIWRCEKAEESRPGLVPVGKLRLPPNRAISVGISPIRFHEISLYTCAAGHRSRVARLLVRSGQVQTLLLGQSLGP
jgi:hypothetical protein